MRMCGGLYTWLNRYLGLSLLYIGNKLQAADLETAWLPLKRGNLIIMVIFIRQGRWRSESVWVMYNPGIIRGRATFLLI